MKKFLLFAGDEYYPRGGFYDFRMSFNSISEAKDHMLKNNESFDWWHIIDSTTMEVVDEYD